MSPKQELERVLDTEHAEAVVEYRRVTIKKPLTAHGAKLLARRFEEARSAGIDPNVAADAMIESTWQGFKAEWLTQPRQNGRSIPAPTTGVAAQKARLRQEIEDDARAESQAKVDPRSSGWLLGFDEPGPHRPN